MRLPTKTTVTFFEGFMFIFHTTLTGSRRMMKLAKQLKYQKSADILHPIEEPIELFKEPAAGTQILVLRGGLFMEMVRLLAETKFVPLAIVVMTRIRYADVNIFFFPTECAEAKVKGGEVLRACLWDFATEEPVSIFQATGDMKSYAQAAVFTRETKTLAEMHMSEVLTVVPLALPQPLPSGRAVSY
ncbi:hypothetical protein AAE478_007509 [Parahypoxylon ruwenzoriense]